VIGDGWPPSSPLEVQVCGTFREVLEVTSDCKAVAIDIPIGLPASKPGSAGENGGASCEPPSQCSGTQGRRGSVPHRDGASDAIPSSYSRWPRVCDLLAQELLGGKGRSRLFLAPPRETLSAENPAKFQALHQSATGVKASLPVWGILPRIREVDAGMTPSLQDRVFEFYPELVWMDLGEMQKPVSHSLMGAQPFIAKGAFPSKHTGEGIEARLCVLGTAGLSIDLHWLTTWKKRLTGCSKVTRADVKLDDLLDAVAGLKAAMDFLRYRATCEDQLASSDQVPRDKQLASLKLAWEGGAFPFSSFFIMGYHPSRIPRLPPTESPLDSKGLRMEIWY